MKPNPKITQWLDRPVFPFWPNFTVEHLFVILILSVTILSRFIILGERVMSHDEVNHVVPAYTFYQGGGYRYDPVTHGPLQFHLITLSYFLFGDSDFSARVPDALFGIAVVAFALFAFKRYLGRVGSLAAGFLFMISPYILYYSRYTRNEIYIVFWGMALIWGVLRYLELGKKSTLLFLTIITALHFTDKATSYIFTAELLIFLAVVFVVRVVSKPWKSTRLRTIFLILILITMLAGMGAFGVGFNALSNAAESHGGDEDVGVMLNELDPLTRGIIGGLALLLLAGVALSAVFLIKGIGWRGVRDERSFDLLIMQGTIVLPLLAALPMDILGFNPLDYSTSGMITSILFIVPLLIIAILIGAWWNWRVWLVNIGAFWAIFTLFYTSLFTQGSGFPMGLMGALGYWMAQQGVTRGTQPLYYYALVQIPIYEFLPAFGTLLAAGMGIPKLIRALQSEEKTPGEDTEDASTSPAIDETRDVEEAIITTTTTDQPVAAISTTTALELEEEEEEEEKPRIVDNAGEYRRPPILAFLLYWSVMSLIAFSFAGERMPWLTTHIAMPMILTSGWSFGKLIESFDWQRFKKSRGWLVLIVGLVLFLSLASVLGTLLGHQRPFQGNELHQLQATSTFLLSLVGFLASGTGLVFLLRQWPLRQVGRFALIVFVLILTVITIRTSYRANYILYDTAKEFLVYAHATRDGKDVLAQVEEISHRLTGGKDMVVAYDNDLLYPYWWYFRDYPNKRWYTDNPTRDLRDAPVILVGSGNYGKIEPVVAGDYVRFDYQRLWWPMQDYYGLTFERVWNAVKNPQMLSALWEIWFNRNYEPYANLKGVSTLTLSNWQPADSFRMYIRKDVVSMIWEYGAAPVSLEPSVDPYEANTVTLEADQIIFGDPQFRLEAPRDIAFAPDGTLYVADSRNHRILHLDTEGNLLHSWGEFGASNYNTNTMAPGGVFNEPWGVAVGPDGSVYVADTWNNRIQKFTAEGDFVTMWGQFGTAELPTNFWGPRGVAVDSEGRVYITDTGNKRVVIFDGSGNHLGAFGGAGLGPGQFDEPVGIAVDDQGRVYIADTWNMRIQVMIPAGEGVLSYPNHITWDIEAWYGDSLENKPFIAVDDRYHVFVADPIMGRILEFDLQGNFLRGWGGYGSGPEEIGIVGGIAVDAEGHVWVADALNNRLMRFSPGALPEGETLPAGTEGDDVNSPFFGEEDEANPPD
jgi:predicted membrane-bound mannosyltransferase/DNA-binding beta-propeller fold protein YncE